MTENADPVTRSGTGSASLRVERVLDSAAELLVRWGYQRVTIDDVARHAGIGKGTVYLHFRSKDALFLTVLLRGHRRLVERVVERMAADPREVLPGRLMAGSYREIAANPVSRALYLGDAEVLGRMAHEAETLKELGARREDALTEHLQLLADAGCLHPQLDVAAARYVFGAVGVGFMVVDGIGGVPALDVEARARLIEHSIAAAVHAPDPPLPALERVAPQIVQRYRSMIDHIDEEWRRRVR